MSILTKKYFQKDNLINTLQFSISMPLEIEAISSNLEQIKDQSLVIAFFEDSLKPNNEINKLDSSINNVVNNSSKTRTLKQKKTK